MEDILAVSVFVLAVLVGCLFRVVNRWIAAQQAHVRQENIIITPELVRVWKAQITKHAKGSQPYESYKASLKRAGIDYGD